MLVSLITRGLITGPARQSLLACRLIAGTKRSPGQQQPPSHSADPSAFRVRPIAVNEALYRLSSLYALRQIGDLSSFFTSIQLGLHRAGAERYIHRLQAFIELVSNDVVVFSVDFENAFQTRSRAKIAEVLYAQPKCAPIWRLFDLAYSAPSHLNLYARDGTYQGTILSQEGVRQGDILASFAYSLSMQPLYEAAVRHCPGSLGSAFIDDLTIAMPVSSTLPTINNLLDLCEQEDIKINIKKSFLLCPDADRSPPAEVEQAAEQYGLQILTGFAPILGSAVGNDLDGMEEYASKKVSNTEPFFTLLKNPHMRSQISYHLLRSCGLPKLNYLARTLPYSVFYNQTKVIHNRVITTFATRMNIPELPDCSLALKQLALPRSVGGFGLYDVFLDSPRSLIQQYVSRNPRHSCLATT
jgi:hypothetical protein